MKKFNKNSIVFIFAAFFLFFGLCGDFFGHVKSATKELALGIIHGNISAALDFKSNIDSITNKYLRYHDTLMDINSIKENLLGTRVVDKTETLVVKADNGTLLGYFQKEKDTETINNEANQIEAYKSISEKNGARYLYCSVPEKTFFGGYPKNVECFNKTNNDRLLSELLRRSIPYINLADSLLEQGFDENDIFFYTDHHWKPLAGFYATKSICTELSNKFDFSYDTELLNISNYSINTYYKQFLGSYGKKVGTYFTWHGLDDFDLITPKFATDLVENRPLDGYIHEGSFEDTLLYLNNLNNNYYSINTYATYSGGDYRLQIIKNNLNPDGMKILLIRNSFSCVVSPFLSLQASELHIVDDRDGNYPAGNKIDIKDYIEKENFDYVIEIK